MDLQASGGVVVAQRFFLGEGPVSVCNVWEVGGAEEGVDAVGEGACEAGDLHGKAE